MAPVNASGAQAREADDATRGSAVRLAAEVVSKLALVATSFLLLRRLGAAEFGLFTGLQNYAVVVAELGELGLQVLAARVLALGTLPLSSLVRTRLLLSGLVALAAVCALPLAPLASGRSGASPSLSLLVVWFALSGWGEFLGVALRCRGGRLREALLLLLLRGSALATTAVAISLGAALAGVTLALALSPLPALALAPLLLRGTRPSADSPEVSPGKVLREGAPLAAYALLLLLSPRVEAYVLQWLRDSRELGLFAGALLVYGFLSMVPGAIAAGAMPALAREAVRGEGLVRRRSAATLALLGAPAAVGLALLARPVAALLLPADASAVAPPLALLAAALPALFLNALLGSALNAVGRAGWLPRLTLARVLGAFALALLLVPRFGALGAAGGLAFAEWLLLGLGWLACRRARFAVPVAQPLAWALLTCVPMALVVAGVRERLWLAVGLGVLTWLATLALALLFAPQRVRQLTGELRYP